MTEAVTDHRPDDKNEDQPKPSVYMARNLIVTEKKIKG